MYLFSFFAVGLQLAAVGCLFVLVSWCAVHVTGNCLSGWLVCLLIYLINSVVGFSVAVCFKVWTLVDCTVVYWLLRLDLVLFVVGFNLNVWFWCLILVAGGLFVCCFLLAWVLLVCLCWNNWLVLWLTDCDLLVYLFCVGCFDAGVCVLFLLVSFVCWFGISFVLALRFVFVWVIVFTLLCVLGCLGGFVWFDCEFAWS